MTAKQFIKSSDTSTSVANSKAEVERVLKRYGADGFSVAQDYGRGTVLVSFIVPNSPTKGAPLVPVKLPVDVLRVFNVIYTKNGRGPWTLAQARDKQNEKAWAQAERVAWRNLVLWIDAALSASAVGLQSIEEAFFAHVALEDGRRVIQVVAEAATEIGNGMPRLLGSGG